MKKTPATTSMEKPQTAEAVLTLINPLPPDEKKNLFLALADQLENEGMKGLGELVRLAPELGSVTEGVNDLRGLLDALDPKEERPCFLEPEFGPARQVLTWALLLLEEKKSDDELRASKQRMRRERIETAEAYQRLKSQHTKQTSALLALVSLPSEQQKSYASKYRDSKDFEGLRQYIKSLMKDYKTLQSRKSASSRWVWVTEFINRIVTTCLIHKRTLMMHAVPTKRQSSK